MGRAILSHFLILSNPAPLLSSSSISKLNGFASKSVRIRQNSKYSNGFRCYCDVSHSQQTSPENSPTSVTVKKRIVSGVQPTGSVHLGNYLGAIKNWIALQNTYETLFFIVDLHAITLPYDTKELSKATRDTAAIYLACGIDASKASVFVQSHVHAHVELMWLLSSATPIGWLNRMIQFKEKSRKAGDENVGVALLTYPVLMASDILLYQSDFVPVGEDQKQHLELTRELAERVNYLYGGRKWKKLGGRGGAIFKVPEPLIPPAGARVMSLTDGLSKMSKSAPSDQSRINLLDPKDVIANKIKRCKTDSFPALEFDNPERPECNNLLSVYQLVSGKTKEDVAKECQGLNWGSFKPLLTDALIEHLHPIQVRWAYMASQLPGRTDNEIKNFWNTHLKKRLTSIGPKLQINQSSSSSEPINIKCKSPSARHMVQWESARVEAEARLSKQSLLIKPTSTAKSRPDIFLQLWKSPSIKNESVFLDDTVSPKPFKTTTFMDTTQEQEDTCKPNEEVMTVSDSIGSNEFADSTDTALKLLLDFPGGNDMEFIGEESEFFQLP